MVQTQKLKTRQFITSTINNDLHKWLKDYSELSSVPVSKLLDKAIILLKASVEPTK